MRISVGEEPPGEEANSNVHSGLHLQERESRFGFCIFRRVLRFYLTFCKQRSYFYFFQGLNKTEK